MATIAAAEAAAIVPAVAKAPPHTHAQTHASARPPPWGMGPAPHHTHPPAPSSSRPAVRVSGSHISRPRHTDPPPLPCSPLPAAFPRADSAPARARAQARNAPRLHQLPPPVAKDAKAAAAAALRVRRGLAELSLGPRPAAAAPH